MSPTKDKITNGNWAKTKTVKNDYLYNSKELNTDLGLNWSDYGARFYDPVVGRFTGVDPISDQFAHLSTYNYAGNSPIANIDPDGRFPWIAIPILIGLNLASKPAIAPTPNTTPLEIKEAHDQYHKELLGAIITPLAIDNLYNQIMDREVVKENDEEQNKTWETRPKPRKGTLKDNWEEAEDHQDGGKQCPSCNKQVTKDPNDKNSGNRDWDNSHKDDNTWKKQQEYWDNTSKKREVERSEVIEKYQEETFLECPSCNRSNNQQDKVE